MTSITRLIQIASTDISAYAAIDSMKATNGDLIVKSDAIPGARKSVLWSEGRKTLGYKFDLLFKPTLADQVGSYDTVSALIDDIDDDAFYPGRSDRFAIAAYGSCNPRRLKASGAAGAILYADAEVWCEEAELYSATPSSWSPTDEVLPITAAPGADGNAATGGAFSNAALAFAAVDCTGLTKANGTLSIDIKVSGDAPTSVVCEITSAGTSDTEEWSKNVVAAITADGAWHRYSFALSDWATWAGELVVSEIDYIRLYGVSADALQICWRNATISFLGTDYPLTTGAAVNYGNLEAGLYSLDLTARMSGPALEFDGTNDHITGSIDLSGNSLSVIYWVRPRASTGYISVSNGGSLSTSGHAHFYVNMATGQMTIRYGDGSARVEDFGVISGFSTDKWYCLGFYYDAAGNNLKCFVNGAQHGTTHNPANPAVALASTSVFVANMAATYYGNFVVSGVRVYRRLLSSQEFEDAYTGETVDDTSLVIEWDFCEGQGATVYDISGNSNDGTLTNFADTSAGYGDSHDGGWLTAIGPASPALQLLGAADAIMDSLTLADTLLTAEMLSQDRFGQVSQTYVCDFTANTGRTAFDSGYFWADWKTWAKYIDSEIVLTSLISSRVGEEISITITDTDQASTTVSVSGYDITVDLETDAGTPVATAQEVIDAINADSDASALVTASLASGEDGSTVLDTQAKTQLALNVDVTGSSLVIEDDREAELRLTGVLPLVAGGLTVTFTPTAAGTPSAGDVISLDVSVDLGATWETVIDSDDDDWADTEEMEVAIPDSIAAGETEVWLRWAIGTSFTSCSLTGVQVDQDRAVADSDWPKIPVGSTYKVQLAGAGWGDLATVWRNRYKP